MTGKRSRECKACLSAISIMGDRYSRMQGREAVQACRPCFVRAVQRDP